MEDKSERVLIHVGQPKAWSTSIQSCLESASEINYLGYFPSFQDRRWYVNDIGRAFEFGMRFESIKSFERNANSYADSVKQALSKSRLNVISCEALTFKCYPGELHTSEKLKRLRLIMREAELQFLYIWRPPEFILNSFYRELVRLGISQDFETFLEQTYHLRDSNFCDDLCGESVIGQVENEFGDTPIYSLSITESAEFDAEQIQRLLQNVLDTPVPKPGHRNRSLDDAVLAALLELNRTEPRLKSFDNLLEHHRLFPALAVDNDSWVWKNARNRRTAVHRAMQVAASMRSEKKIVMKGGMIDDHIRLISEGKRPPPERTRL